MLCIYHLFTIIRAKDKLLDNITALFEEFDENIDALEHTDTVIYKTFWDNLNTIICANPVIRINIISFACRSYAGMQYKDNKERYLDIAIDEQEKYREKMENLSRKYDAAKKEAAAEEVAKLKYEQLKKTHHTRSSGRRTRSKTFRYDPRFGGNSRKKQKKIKEDTRKGRHKKRKTDRK